MKPAGRPLVFFGTANVDLCFTVERLPTRGESVLGKFARRAGGKGANQAVAAGRLGARPHLVTRLGSDGESAFLRRSLEQAGVSTDAIEDTVGAATGTAMVVVGDDGSNMIAIDPGANDAITPEDIAKAARLIAPGAVVVAEMGLPVPALERLCALKAERDFLLVFNPAPVRQGLSRSAWEAVDIATPNESEIYELTGIEARDDASALAAVDAARAMGPKAVALTLGERGIVYRDDSQTIRLSAFPVHAVDTTAAGDAFNGGFAAGIASGLAVGDAMRRAIAVAALCVTRRGAQESMPTLAEVDDFLLQTSLSE